MKTDEQACVYVRLRGDVLCVHASDHTWVCLRARY